MTIGKTSSNKKNLTNKTYEKFLNELIDIFKECKRVLKPGKYINVIVSDFRHKSKYYMFHADLTKRLEDIGYHSKGLTFCIKDIKEFFLMVIHMLMYQIFTINLY